MQDSSSTPTPGLLVGDPEVRAVSLASSTKFPDSDILDRLRKFSNWDLLRRVVARIKKLASRQNRKDPLTVSEVEKAGIIVIKLAQQEVFWDEIDMLQRSKTVTSSSRIHNLNPFIDDHGLIRIGGRLGKSSMPAEEKHPIILPKTSHLSKLIILHYHKEIRHQGRGLTLAALRSNGFWIQSGSVKTLIKDCVTCIHRTRSHLINIIMMMIN